MYRWKSYRDRMENEKKKMNRSSLEFEIRRPRVFLWHTNKYYVEKTFESKNANLKTTQFTVSLRGVQC